MNLTIWSFLQNWCCWWLSPCRRGDWTRLAARYFLRNVFSVLRWLGPCPSRQVYTQPLLFSTVCLPAPKQLQVVFPKALLPVQFVLWQAEHLVLFIAQQQWCDRGQLLRSRWRTRRWVIAVTQNMWDACISAALWFQVIASFDFPGNLGSL